MTRQAAITTVTGYYDQGNYLKDLAALVAVPTESQEPERTPDLWRYLEDEISPRLTSMGFTIEIMPNPQVQFGPFLIGTRLEDASLPTVLIYGHGDVIRGHEGRWRDDRSPWKLDVDGDRLYGRGVVDNKGQHLLNMEALRAVISARGKLGFNVKVLIETGEETGSPGLHTFCDQQRDKLAADVLIASDGPRITPDMPTVFTGSRGAVNMDLTCRLREGGHHSGNWGGLLANPGIVLAHAIASITDAKGKILVPEWQTTSLTQDVRDLLDGLEVAEVPDGPRIDHDWGEPGLTAAEKVYGWNSFEVLAYRTGDPSAPVNAIPPLATAHCQVRYVVGTDPDDIVPALQRHLDKHGFSMVKAERAEQSFFKATRLSPTDPWLMFTRDSMAKTSGKRVGVLPNLGGSLPNDAFSEVLGLPTIWVPHSYTACSQHAPNEHGLGSMMREGLQLMTGLFWDLGEHADDLPRL